MRIDNPTREIFQRGKSMAMEFTNGLMDHLMKDLIKMT